VHRTPVFSSRSLGAETGARVHLKAELFQRTGSFKFRGALHRVTHLTEEERVRGVITFSAGNHAQGVALACREAGVDCLVLMPAGASEAKVVATAAYGARIDQSAGDAAGMIGLADELIAKTGRVLVHPFDDPLVMAGQGTLGLELLDQVPDLQTVLVPFSGGGLIGGVATVMAPAGVKVIGIRPAQRPTIADALTAPFVGAHCQAAVDAHVHETVEVSEDEFAAAFRFLHVRAKLAAEPSAGAGVAALLAGRYGPAPGEVVAVVVSGGNVAPAVAARLLAAA